MEHQLDATITVLLILKINKTGIVASSWCSIFTLPTLMMHGQTQIKWYNLFSAKIKIKGFYKITRYATKYSVPERHINRASNGPRTFSIYS
jgi:hypothetical protein